MGRLEDDGILACFSLYRGDLDHGQQAQILSLLLYQNDLLVGRVQRNAMAAGTFTDDQYGLIRCNDRHRMTPMKTDASYI